MSTQQPQSKSLGHVVVTGGCGFLGSHIVELLLERSITSKVSVVDLRTTQNRQDKADYYDGDITDSDGITSLFEKLKPDVVIHTASPVFNANRPDLMYKVNVDGTKVLIKAAQESGVKAFVYTSSASVISDQKSDLVYADERWAVLPESSQPEYYSTTKAQAEAHVLASNRQPSSTFLTCAIRPAGLFGPRDVQLLPPVLAVHRGGRTHWQIGPNSNLFDFTYVGNAAHAHILAASALLATPRGSQATVPLDTERIDGEAFIVTNDEPVYFWDFARAAWREAARRLGIRPPTETAKVWELSREFAMALGGVLEGVFWALGRKPSLTRQQARYSCQTRYFCIEKAKRRLGYRPIVNLQEGIRRGVEDVVRKDEALKEAPGFAEKKGL
ncbi:MAG: erg26, C-3 sterol dehydrogenase [Bathelium mastoideum]|nr:MAG: erg26, C-3 sterol dehydrogenase [Bathelium mastoideum]KAI9694653.1 MAG: erg26, C-3 sterol dehydrogenase [Bathelium mastoideum]